MDLTEFLLARIAEEVEEARVARYSVLPDGLWEARRILAECEAKRRIVEDIYPDLEKDNDALNCEFGATSADPEDILRLLALPYADHPDFREEWRP